MRRIRHKPLKTTVKVQVRHARNCKHKSKGPYCRLCGCPKILRVYAGGGGGTNRRVSLNTNSWDEAEAEATKLRNNLDPHPAQQELNRMKAKQEAEQTTIEAAVALYLGDMAARKIASGTVAVAKSLFGHVGVESKLVEKNGHLFDWLERLAATSRPNYISDLTVPQLTAWRASWKFGDYTASQRWAMVRSFFNFCVAQGWIQDNPARKLRRIEYDKGSRTSLFTDQQYATILEAVAICDPENVPEITRKNWQQRLTTFVELLRWSGMAPIDAVQFRPEQIDGEGVLRYKRQKTGVLATVPLPENVLALLRSVPLEKDSIGPEQPFRLKDFTPDSDRITWSKRINRLFELAEIKPVTNEVGRVRKVHVYMLRDTFAVWNLRHGVPIHALARMMGHSNPAITARAYAPFVEELQKSTIAEGRAALEKAKSGKPGKVISMSNK